jgi:NAD(P)H-dependent FMN reductase
MVTIISGTNRANNQSIKFAKHYQNLLKDYSVESQILDLSDLPHDFLFTALYGNVNEKFNAITEKYIYNASKIVIVSPEYNGSYPGIVKAFIDGWNPKKLSGQKVALVGVASGRQGNMRGMDQLSNVMNYLQLTVVPKKVAISQVHLLSNEQGFNPTEEINNFLHTQINMLLK